MRSAVILAAGNGDRFPDPDGTPKLLQPLDGRPLLLRTLDQAHAAGIRHAAIVVGYEADKIRAAVERGAPVGLATTFVVNPDWHLENGVSALHARAIVNGLPGSHFAVLMGDHVFESRVLHRLLEFPLAPDRSVLAVDTRTADSRVTAEATKVRLDRDRVVAIGKDLAEFDALDTGMFVCARNLFEALERSRDAGDTTLSGGIRQLAASGHMHAFDIGDARWYDVDTPGDLAAAAGRSRE